MTVDNSPKTDFNQTAVVYASLGLVYQLLYVLPLNAGILVKQGDIEKPRWVMIIIIFT